MKLTEKQISFQAGLFRFVGVWVALMGLRKRAIQMMILQFSSVLVCILGLTVYKSFGADTIVAYGPTAFDIRIDANGNISGERMMDVSVTHNDPPSWLLQSCEKISQAELRFDEQPVDRADINGGKGFCTFNSVLRASVIADGEARGYCTGSSNTSHNITKKVEVDFVTASVYNSYVNEGPGKWVNLGDYDRNDLRFVLTANFNIHVECLSVPADPCKSFPCPTGQACRTGTFCYDPCCGVECRPDEACVAGSCFPRDLNCDSCPPETCNPDGDCALCGRSVIKCSLGQVCENESCVSDPICESIMCPTGTVCDKSQCVSDPTCKDVKCPCGQTCESGHCIYSMDFQACEGVVCEPGILCMERRCSTSIEYVFKDEPAVICQSLQDSFNSYEAVLTEYEEQTVFCNQKSYNLDDARLCCGNTFPDCSIHQMIGCCMNDITATLSNAKENLRIAILGLENEGSKLKCLHAQLEP